MPEPFEATREQWHQWFEGNNYKNIPEITKLCGEEISSEDFSKGIYRYKGLVLHGTYKIFFEPLISAIVDGNAMFLTLRDAIKYNEERNNEQDYNNTIVWKLNLMFEYLANPAYLIIDEEEALNMYANSGEYKVEYIRSKYNESCTEIIDEMKPGGRIYNSMGVGVVCKEYEVPPEPVIVEEPEPEVPEIPIASVTEEVTGALKAEDRDTGELYDVDKGIPSTEKLYANVISNEYLKDFDFELVQGSRDYTVKVKRTYYLHYQDWFPNSDDCSNCTGGRVDDPDDPDPAKTIPCGNCNGDGLVSGYDWTYDTYDYSATYPITRHYQYWNITELGIYEIENAEVTNDALDGDKATIAVDQAKYNKPVINEFKHDPDIDYHVLNDPMADAVANGSISVVGSEYVLQLGPKDITPTGDDTIKPSVGSPDFSGDVKNAVGNFKVRNDTLVFNGQTIMSGAIDDDGIAEPPTDIPMAPMTGKNVLYEKGLEIPAEMPNGTYATNAAVKYRLLEDSLNPPRGDEVILTGELNPVTVHTPVVCNSGVREEYARSQQLGAKESERMELILGRDSMIKFQTEAYMHRDIKGYGDRDYTKYVKAKYVRFPFDIYIKNVSGGWDYVPKDSWHEVDKSQEYADIRAPVWVDEGEYTVNFKTIAINAPEDIDDPGDADFSKAPGDTGSMQEYMANKDMANYVAYRDSKVRVVGRVELLILSPSPILDQ